MFETKRLEATIEKVTDPAEIASWGVMTTPALVIDDDVLIAGRFPSGDEVRDLISQGEPRTPTASPRRS